MFLVERTKEGVKSLPAKRLEIGRVKVLGSKLAQRIVAQIAKEATYPSKIAKILKENEQKVYYHIRNLEKAGIIEITRTEIIQGATANIYNLRKPAMALVFRELKETQKVPGFEEKPISFLEPFIESGQLNSVIVVGSPDPHGPDKARSRDGYYGIDFALFLGSFLNYIPDLVVKLDTEVTNDDLNKNLILIGGPVVNTVMGKINDKLPIKFDKNNNWAIMSEVSREAYHSDETGMIVKAKNPFNPKKKVLVIAGKRYAGTRAVMIAFLKYFNDIVKGNSNNKRIMARIVEGVDLDSDGQVDDVEFLE